MFYLEPLAGKCQLTQKSDTELDINGLRSPCLKLFLHYKMTHKSCYTEIGKSRCAGTQRPGKVPSQNHPMNDGY